MDSTATDRALSEVVGFVMILGVIVVGLSIYQVYFVPAEGREDEIVHMGVVNERFTDYKVSLDSLWINNWTGSTLSTSFDLGTGGSNTQNAGWSINLFAPVYSTGTVKVNQRNENVSIYADSPSSPNDYTNTFTMGELEYLSGNNYWVQQNHYYQMGGVFLTQENENGSTIRIFPPLSIYQIQRSVHDPPTAKITLTAIQIQGDQIISGGGPVRIDTRLRSGTERVSLSHQDLVTITINATDVQTARMWERVFSEAILKGGIPTDWYEINRTGASTTLSVWGNITSGSQGVDFELTRVNYVVSVQSLARGV